MSRTTLKKAYHKGGSSRRSLKISGGGIGSRLKDEFNRKFFGRTRELKGRVERADKKLKIAYKKLTNNPRVKMSLGDFEVIKRLGKYFRHYSLEARNNNENKKE